MLGDRKQTGGPFGNQIFTFEVQFKDKEIKFTPYYVLVHHSFCSIRNWPQMIKEYAQKGIELEYYGDASSSTMMLMDAYAKIQEKVNAFINRPKEPASKTSSDGTQGNI
jgi:hypothetical protein